MKFVGVTSWPTGIAHIGLHTPNTTRWTTGFVPLIGRPGMFIGAVLVGMIIPALLVVTLKDSPAESSRTLTA